MGKTKKKAHGKSPPQSVGPCDFLSGALAPTDLAQNTITRFTDYLENDQVQSLTMQLKPVLQDIATLVVQWNLS